MRPARAIVVLAVGSPALARWRRSVRPAWQRYAERHGYDLVCLEAPPDDAAADRPVSWHKCLVPGQPFAARYERLALIDADLLVNPEAPDIAADLPVDQIGAVDELAWPDAASNAAVRARLARLARAQRGTAPELTTARALYEHCGLGADHDRVIAPGLLVVSPRHHRHALAEAYRAARPRDGIAGGLADLPLSHALLASTPIDWLDARFNVLWYHCKAARYPFLIAEPGHDGAAAAATTASRDTYALNFVGCPDEIELVAPALLPARSVTSGPSDGRAPRLERTAVALFIHRRPETAARVLDAIRAARPPALLVVADGPRHAGEVEACARARAVVDRVDWPCEVLTHFSDDHLGWKRRFETGMAWIFGRVDEAILLEDDCVPHPTFFAYCEALLDRYRDDERILTVSGDSFHFGLHPFASSYYFSRYPLIWGWATWRRAWRLYDATPSFEPGSQSDRWLDGILHDERAVRYWSYIFTTRRDHWDYAWTLASWRHGGRSVLPGVNLVSNVGFDAGAAHSTTLAIEFAELPAQAIAFPLRHPSAVTSDEEADRFVESVVFSGALRRLFRTARAREARDAAPPVRHRTRLA